MHVQILPRLLSSTFKMTSPSMSRRSVPIFYFFPFLPASDHPFLLSLLQTIPSLLSQSQTISSLVDPLQPIQSQLRAIPDRLPPFQTCRGTPLPSPQALSTTFEAITSPAVPLKPRNKALTSLGPAIPEDRPLVLRGDCLPGMLESCLELEDHRTDGATE